MGNILTAIKSIVDFGNLVIEDIENGNNRMNNMGEGLENYIKNAFADTFLVKRETERLKKFEQTFSYFGNKTNPPDIILKGSDAIEIKKIESLGASLQLNSSHPKEKLLITDTKINKACRTCESWTEKDLLYAIGYVKNKELKNLWMVYGDCYAAEAEIYERVERRIKDNISQIEDIEINDDTNELSGVRNIDPLNITYLRVRGMWIIENPNKVFDYIYSHDPSVDFQCIALMRTSKYNNLPEADRRDIMTLVSHGSIEVEDVRIKNPNNPAMLIDAKMIVFKVS